MGRLQKAMFKGLEAGRRSPKQDVKIEERKERAAEKRKLLAMRVKVEKEKTKRKEARIAQQTIKLFSKSRQ